MYKDNSTIWKGLLEILRLVKKQSLTRNSSKQSIILPHNFRMEMLLALSPQFFFTGINHAGLEKDLSSLFQKKHRCFSQCCK